MQGRWDQLRYPEHAGVCACYGCCVNPFANGRSTHMQDAVLTKLRRDFDTAITSRRNVVTLDPSIAELRERISQAAFFESFSIFSRSQLRRINGCLGHIS